MNRRQLFQALGGALLLPYEPKTIYSFSAPEKLVSITEDMITFDKLAPMPGIGRAAVHAKLVAQVKEVLDDLLRQTIVPTQYLAVISTHSMNKVVLEVQFDGRGNAQVIESKRTT
jgi:hypothetical protein